MRCTNCGIHLPSGLNFCWNCGNELVSMPKSDRVRVTFTDIMGSKHTDVTLKLSLTGEEVIDRLIKNEFLTSPDEGQVYTLEVQRSGITIQPNQSLSNARILEGDVLITGVMTRGGGGISIRSFRDIQLIESVLNHSDNINSADKAVLFAVVLYTDEDDSLANYIRENVRNLHMMSGNSCMFFVIEQPSDEWRYESKKYLGSLTNKYFEAVWERLGTNSFRPYEKSKAYEIAQKFNVKPKQLPCILFFPNLQSQEVLIVELKCFIESIETATSEEYSQFFRMIFSHVQDVMVSGSKSPITLLSNQIKKEEKKQKNGKPKRRDKQIEIIKLGSSFVEIIGALLKMFIP